MQIERLDVVLDLYTTVTECPRRFAMRLSGDLMMGRKLAPRQMDFDIVCWPKLMNFPIDNDLR